MNNRNEAEAGEAVAPLPSTVRMSDGDYPGVVAQLGPEWRLVVSAKAERYALQQRVAAHGGPVWVPAGGNSPKTLPRIVAKYGGKVAGLAEAAEGLPQDPAEALPEFAARRDALSDYLAATDWARDRYAGEVARDGSLRLVVTPCRAFYRLQWVAKRDIGTGAEWRTVCTASSLADVWRFVLASVAGVVEGQPGAAGLVRGQDLEPQWLAMVAGLPDKPGQIDLPRLPSSLATPQE